VELVSRTLRWQRAVVCLVVAGTALAFWRPSYSIFGTAKATVVLVGLVALAVIGAVRVTRTRRLVLPSSPLLWPVASFAAALVVATLLSRRVWHWLISRARRRGRLTFRTLIVGANDEAEALSREMRLQGLGFTPVGYVTSDREANTARNLPILGSTRELRRVIAGAGAFMAVLERAAVVGGAVMGYFGGVAVWVSCFVLGLVIAVLQVAIGPVRERRIQEITKADLTPATR
jgi:FlaA1/EpsC-like NDP-sugar epimerase